MCVSQSLEKVACLCFAFMYLKYINAQLHYPCGNDTRLHLCYATHALGMQDTHHTVTCIEGDRERAKKLTNGIIWSLQPFLTFSNYLFNSDLVSPDSKCSSNEIAACVAGPRAAASSSRTRPGAD